MAELYSQSALLINALRCVACGVDKPLEAFNKDRSRPSGHHPYCKPCVKAKRRTPLPKARKPITVCRNGHEFTPENTFYFPDGARQCRICREGRSERRLETFLRWHYGITADQYAAILSVQNGCCVGCRMPPTNKRLVVDHDHITGEVRGLLCDACNRAIGQLRDDPATARRLADYLEDPPAAKIIPDERSAPVGPLKPRLPELAAVAPYVPQRRVVKLTDEDIKAIRARVEQGEYTTYKALAAEFGVCQRTVRDIVKGRVWQEIM